MKYHIETPNKLYNGVTAGVAFASGKATVEDAATAKLLERDYGYKVTAEGPKKPASKAKSSAK